MTVAQQYVAQRNGGRGGPSGLADVLEVLLDKGLVIDAFVRVSLVGIELLTIDVRVVIASVDTYLHFAEAVNRLDLLQVNNSQTVPELFGSKSSSSRSSDSSGNSDSSRKAGSSGGSPRAALDSGSGQQDQARGDDKGGTGASDRDEDNNGKGLLSRIADRGHAF